MENLTVYEPGDRFATISTEGRARVWEVAEDGLPAQDSAAVRVESVVKAGPACEECGEPPHHHLVVCSRVNDV
jgi:hypothetical protein